jgi:hypothetical protein
MKLTLLLAILTLSIATSVRAGTVATGLIGHYTFDNAASLGEDSSGFGNHADFLNNVGYTPSGILSGGAVFVASQSSNLRWTGASDPIANVLAGDYTFSIWIKTTQTFGLNGGAGFDGAGIVYADLPGSANDGIPIALNGDQAGHFTGGAGQGNTIHSSSAINTGEFVHVVVTRNLATGEKKIYVNGMQEASATHETGLPLNQRQELAVGGNLFDGRYFEGTLDELRVYNEVLMQTEIDLLFAAPVPEPSTIALLSSALALGVAARFKRTA